MVLLHRKGSHFTCRDTGHTFLLSHCRNVPKLSHQAQGIKVGPLFGDLASHEAKEIAAAKRHVFPSWGKTLKGLFLAFGERLKTTDLSAMLLPQLVAGGGKPCRQRHFSPYQKDWK